MCASSMRVPFLFILVMTSSALLADPQQVKPPRETASDPRVDVKPETKNTSERPNVTLLPDATTIQYQVITVLYQEPAFQGIGTELTSDAGVTIYRIYVNRRLLPDDKLSGRLKEFFDNPAKFLDLPLASGTSSAVVAQAAETACVGPWCFKPVRMEPVRTFAAPMGGSTSTKAGCFEGTVGVRVADNTSGAMGYATNNHVAGAEGPLLCPNARRAQQVAPGTKVTMCHAGPTAGTLHRRSIIEFAPQTNLVDAAFVKAGDVKCDGCGIHPTGGSYTLAETASLAFPTSSPPPLQQCGAASGHTTNGTLISKDAWVRLILLPCGLTAQFEHQIEIKGQRFAKSGDSGAWVFDAQGKAVGMIFAGDEDKTTFVNPADAVLSLLGIHIVPCP